MAANHIAGIKYISCIIWEKISPIILKFNSQECELPNTNAKIFRKYIRSLITMETETMLLQKFFLKMKEGRGELVEGGKCGYLLQILSIKSVHDNKNN